MFWIINAALILIAIAFILPALLRKQTPQKDSSREQNIYIANEQLKDLETRFEKGEIDDDGYASSRDEIEQSLFSDVSEDTDRSSQKENKASLVSTILILLLIPIIAIPVYMKVGNDVFTNSLDSKEAAKNALKDRFPQNPDGTPDIDTMVAGLQKKMEADPNNAKGWYMLGRSYMMLKRYENASDSFDKALKLKPKSVNIMLSLADSLSMVNDSRIVGRSAELINKALEIDPENLTALWLGGMSARQQGNSLVAIERWKSALKQVTDPTERQEVNSLISEAEKQLTPAQRESLNVSSAGADTPSIAKSIAVTVSLSDKMKAQVSPTDIVFVYAKAMSGPPMPLAAAKIQVKDLPIKVILNDEMAMMPSLKLSSFSEVVVGARVSKSGQPISQNGDLYTEKRSVKLGASVTLDINAVVSK